MEIAMKASIYFDEGQKSKSMGQTNYRKYSW